MCHKALVSQRFVALSNRFFLTKSVTSCMAHFTSSAFPGQNRPCLSPVGDEDMCAVAGAPKADVLFEPEGKRAKR